AIADPGLRKRIQDADLARAVGAGGAEGLRVEGAHRRAADAGAAGGAGEARLPEALAAGGPAGRLCGPGHPEGVRVAGVPHRRSPHDAGREADALEPRAAPDAERSRFRPGAAEPERQAGAAASRLRPRAAEPAVRRAHGPHAPVDGGARAIRPAAGRTARPDRSGRTVLLPGRRSGCPTVR